MSVPIITNIDPNNGQSRGGNLLKITGTGFRVPPTPPPGPTDGVAYSTIKVKIDGRESSYAHVLTATEAIVRVPEWRGDPKALVETLNLDVWLANLDDDGLEIAGENVTVVGGYTIRRPKLTKKTVVETVIEGFINYIRRYVHANVWFTMERIYWDSADGVPDEIKNANLPLIHINGATTDPNELAQAMGVQEFPVAGDSTRFTQLEPATATDLIFADITCYSNEKHVSELIGLASAFVEAFTGNPFLVLPAPEYDTINSEYEYPIVFTGDGYPDFDVGPEIDGLKNFKVAVIIESIDWTTKEGVEEDIGSTVEDIDSPEINWNAT